MAVKCLGGDEEPLERGVHALERDVIVHVEERSAARPNICLGLSTIVKQVLVVKWCISSRSRIGSGKSRTGGGTEFVAAEVANTVCCPNEDSGVEGKAEAAITVEPPSSWTKEQDSSKRLQWPHIGL